MSYFQANRSKKRFMFNHLTDPGILHEPLVNTAAVLIFAVLLEE